MVRSVFKTVVRVSPLRTIRRQREPTIVNGVAFGGREVHERH